MYTHVSLSEWGRLDRIQSAVGVIEELREKIFTLLQHTFAKWFRLSSRVRESDRQMIQDIYGKGDFLPCLSSPFPRKSVPC